MVPRKGSGTNSHNVEVGFLGQSRRNLISDPVDGVEVKVALLGRGCPHTD